MPTSGVPLDDGPRDALGEPADRLAKLRDPFAELIDPLAGPTSGLTELSGPAHQAGPVGDPASGPADQHSPGVPARDRATDVLRPSGSAAAGQPEDTQDVGTIGRKASKGLRWALMGSVVTKLGSFAMSLVLVRLLVPADFGLYAVALVATQFVIHVNDMGMIAATVQWRGRVEEMTATASTLALAFSAAWYGLFWIGAPYLAELAGSPDATGLIRLLTATILIDGLTAVRVGIIQRTFRQDALTGAIMAGFAANAVVAITMAANGGGAYSFVIGQLVQATVTGIIVMLVARMPLRFGLDRPVARRLLRFGWPLALALGVESMLMYSDQVIVGNALGPVVLGFYLLAFNISSWVPGIVGTAIRYVSIPSFSRLAESEESQFADGVRKAFPMMIGLVLPIAVAMGVLAAPLVQVLYGSEWLPAAQALQFLAIVMVVRMTTAFAFDILTALGRTSATVLLNIGWAVALIPALMLGTHLGGIRGAAMAHALVAVTVALPLALAALHRGGVRVGAIARALRRPIGAAAAAGVVMALLATVVPQHAWLDLVLAGGVGVLVYAAGVFGLRPWARPAGQTQRKSAMAQDAG